IQIAETRQPMIDRDHNHVAETRQLRSIVARTVTGAGGEAAPMKRNHHRALLSIVYAGRPDVQGEHVFTHATDIMPVPLDHHPVVAAHIGECLRTDLSVTEALLQAGPGSRLPRGHEAIPTAGGRAIGDAFEFLDAGVGNPLYFSSRSFHGPEKLAGAVSGKAADGTVGSRTLCGRLYAGAECCRSQSGGLQKASPAGSHR